MCIRDRYTKMRNVAGLSTSDAQKSSYMFAKCRYMDEITGNRGVIFATGTPVSNSMTELYTMPVSYTHLDVYKRQIPSKPSSRRWRKKRQSLPFGSSLSSISLW